MDEATSILMRAIVAEHGLLLCTQGDPAASLAKLYRARKDNLPLFEGLSFQRHNGKIYVTKTAAEAA